MNKKNTQKAFSLIELSIVILIIGILVAGVTQSSRLVNEIRLSSARSVTQSYPVYSIPGISSWIETTLESSFNSDFDDGATVSQINDIIGKP
jgi:prepilin-type N-terminal cleavage/methylation domain-containing protein